MTTGELIYLLNKSGVKKLIDADNTIVCLDTLASTQPCPQACTSKEEENKMYYNENMEMEPTSTENERKAQYFQGELNNSSYRKRTELSTEFNMDAPAAPNSPKDLVQWIKDGWFTFQKNKLNDDGSWRDESNTYYSPINLILWKNPNRKEEEMVAALDKLDGLAKKTERQINAASTPAEMLKALEEFESTTSN